MRLIIKQYLASLKEREELDAILPDLLSAAGLTVISTPSRGTKQDGVDVAAVGSIENDRKSLYLFSIKSGDLNRTDWNSSGEQALRPSLDEIKDVYINTKIPNEYAKLPIKICLCFGGNIKEQILSSVTGYIDNNSTDKISYQIWNGDKLADLIITYLLREDLILAEYRGHLRKSLALLEEPSSSYLHFYRLCRVIVSSKNKSDVVIKIRQICLCNWILFSWCRNDGNIEAAYMASELSLLLAWDLRKTYVNKNSKSKNVHNAFMQIINLHLSISKEYLIEKIHPLKSIQNGISASIYPNCPYAKNAKLFDIISRLATYGVWLSWIISYNEEISSHSYDLSKSMINDIYDAITDIIRNNSTLLSPFNDDNAIDIAICLYFLSLNEQCDKFIIDWLSQMLMKIKFAFNSNDYYPITLTKIRAFSSKNKNCDLYQSIPSSILYPILYIYISIFDLKDSLKTLSEIKSTFLPKTNFQIWFPNKKSELDFYKNDSPHGLVFPSLDICKDDCVFFKIILDEANKKDSFHDLSAIEQNIYPLIFLACRHYRIPLPINFIIENFEEKITYLSERKSATVINVDKNSHEFELNTITQSIMHMP